MPHGPGKYDDVATVALKSTKARGVIVMVFDGEKGTGFSVQAPADVQLRLPVILRDVADQIERDLGGAKNGNRV